MPHDNMRIHPRVWMSLLARGRARRQAEGSEVNIPGGWRNPYPQIRFQDLSHADWRDPPRAERHLQELFIDIAGRVMPVTS